MEWQSSFITLNALRFYAYHGVMEQEQRVGGWYTLTLRVGYDWRRAATTDDVADTLNYATLYDVLKSTMAVPSRLLEHVAGRIVSAVGEQFPEVTSIDLWLTKDTPPMGADLQGATVELHCGNNVS